MKYNKIRKNNGIWVDFCQSNRIREREKRLRRCKASVGVTTDGRFTYLRSYGTIVCVIDNITGEAVDTLRTEFGYYGTSAQHIAKFLHDYPHKKLFRTNYDKYGRYYIRIY